ncbi:MAG: hypothetical protein NZL99_03050, partial [Burkholderiaceae bacterium]|nr:hypothetical protein [Burkholderiaceae bacterium]
MPAADAAVALVHHLPPRSGPPLRALDVRRVYRADDLPSYLLFGVRDDAGFRAGADGWSAIWRGTQPDTWLRGEYRRGSDTLRFTQRWCGIAAGEGMFPASVLPEEALGALYRQH